MFKQLTLSAATLALGAGALLPATAADAQRYRGSQYDRSYDDRYYDNGRVYRGNDNRNRYREVRKCSNGTTGAIVGAIAGGLLGRVIDSRGDRAVGTILGGAGGALAGRAIERGGSQDAADRGRCYR